MIMDTIRKLDDDLVVVLPADILERLGWGSGDAVQISVEGADIRIVRTKTKHDRAMEIADELMDEYRDTLSALAKQ